MPTKIILLLLTLCMLTTVPTYAENTGKTKSLRWKINNYTWDETHELAYQAFVHALGMGRKNNFCKTTDECLRSPHANPYYHLKNPSRLQSIYADCADLPFILRAYFSWMNDLPFAYASDLRAASGFSSKASDIRYSRYGNIVTAKDYVLQGENVNNVFQSITDTISSGSLRTNASKNDYGYLFRDTYPVDIDRKYIAPGTVLYDPNGHVAVVYDVTPNGKIHLIDAHPDNSLSYITYGEKFARSSIQVGGGFSNFRPFSIAGGIVPKKNIELPGYALIQYYKGPFIYKGQQVTYYEYVRHKLADGDIVYNPITEFTNALDELCQDIKYREEAVNTSLEANIQDLPHPEYLPENIYGTDGVWEMYATPARDARLKASVREIKELLTKITGHSTYEIIIDYDGPDLIADLRNIYLQKSKSCTVKVSSKKSIDMDFILDNLFALSFDPYHCAELRWGITGTSSCSTTANKLKWYTAEQGLRNRIERDNTIKTDYDVYTLPNAPVSQVEKPDLNFDHLLDLPIPQ